MGIAWLRSTCVCSPPASVSINFVLVASVIFRYVEAISRNYCGWPGSMDNGPEVIDVLFCVLSIILIIIVERVMLHDVFTLQGSCYVLSGGACGVCLYANQYS